MWKNYIKVWECILKFGLGKKLTDFKIGFIYYNEYKKNNPELWKLNITEIKSQSKDNDYIIGSMNEESIHVLSSLKWRSFGFKYLEI